MALTACEFVYPTPPDGAPVPQLQFSLSEPEPLKGEFTITVTAVNFDPQQMTFRLDDFTAAPIHVDSSAPFTLTLNTADLTTGPHDIWVNAKDATYTVRQKFRPAFWQPPNLVAILVDDLDETGTPYWDAMPQTRALLADQGLVFENAFVTDPVCCPSRAANLTGRYPHNTGVFDNSPPDGGYQVFAAGPQNDTIATRLQSKGYATSFFGKYLNGYNHNEPVPPGWTEWFATHQAPYFVGFGYNANHNGTTETFGWDTHDYETDVLSRHARDFITASEADDARPFYVSINPLAPHANMGPAPRHQPNPYGAAVLPTSPNFNEADVSDKPTWLRDGFPLASESDLQNETTRYRQGFGSLLAVDDMVADLVDTLEQTGELEQTVFVFTSDNGYNLRSHRLGHKMVPYEESIRVPFVVAGAGVRVGTEDRFVTNIDITPTLLELADAGPQPDLDGRSFAPLLADEPTQWRSDFLIEYRGTYVLGPRLDTLADVQAAIAAHGSLTVPPSYRALRTEEWLYVEWYSGAQHEYELYDMAADQYQLSNLISTPAGAAAHETLTDALQARLVQLGACSGATCRE